MGVGIRNNKTALEFERLRKAVSKSPPIRANNRHQVRMGNEADKPKSNRR